MKKLSILLASSFFIATLTTQAALNWTGGAGDYEIFNQANWSKDGQPLDPNDLVADHVISSSVSGGVINVDTGGSALNTQAGFWKMEKDTVFTISGGGSFSIYGARFASEDTVGHSTVNVSGGTMILAEDFRRLNVHLSGGSFLTIEGTKKNYVLKDSTIFFTKGDSSYVIFENFDKNDFETLFMDQFKVNGQDATLNDLVITDISGGGVKVTVTAVPEPSSSALFALGGIALILRRRK